MKTILVLHGPNLPLLGLTDIEQTLSARGDELGVEVVGFQGNSEGALLDELLRQRLEVDALLVNPGVLAPQAWALAEALTLLKLPAVEVLLAPLVDGRGPSALAGAVKAHVHDRGKSGYVAALELLVKELGVTPPPEPSEDDDDEDEDDDEPVRRPTRPGASARAEKTIGRKPVEAPAEPARLGKTIGRRVEGAPKATAAASGLLTRAAVREKLNARLKGTLSADALAAWARAEWSKLNAGGPCEESARSLLDSVLLTVMGGTKATDAIVLSQLARLDP